MPDSSQQPVQSFLASTRQKLSSERRPWYHVGRVARILFGVYALLLILFAILAWWAHAHPISPIDVAITQEFQEYPFPWLSAIMLIISYPGSSFLLPTLIVLAALFCWIMKWRLEAIFIASLSLVSWLLNISLKLLVERPRPTSQWVDILQAAKGLSFPSGHVMAYLAFWGLLFSFGIILLRGMSWWRIALLAISAVFIILVGPSRIYLGDHWASDVLGSYLIGGVLLGLALWLYLRFKALN
ncbi:MAG TPA: phosphatase PAP2 family protein [Ktedonobacteraceae bacterium]|nr:phosphatase PAP2 family protein [Ktedonobacteraceae bacterium]